MGPLGYLELRPGLEGVGLFLLAEGFQPTLASLVDVIDDPGLPRVALGVFQLRLRMDI